MWEESLNKIAYSGENVHLKTHATARGMGKNKRKNLGQSPNVQNFWWW